MVLVVLLFPINSSMSVGESRQSPWKSYANAVANIRRSTPLKLCQISDFLCVSRCGGFSLSYQQCIIHYANQSNKIVPIKKHEIFLEFSTTMHQKFIHFPRHSSAGESNFHTVEYRIIDNTSQWLNFQAGSTLWSRQLHFVIVLQSLGPSCFPIYRNEVSFVQSGAECEKMMSWGSRQAWKKFELSLISGMAAFSLSFDARSQSCQWSQWICCCRRSSFLRSIEPLPYWCQLAFIQSRRAPFYSPVLCCCCCEKHESRQKKEGERVEFHMCESLHIVKLK